MIQLIAQPYGVPRLTYDTALHVVWGVHDNMGLIITADSTRCGWTRHDDMKSPLVTSRPLPSSPFLSSPLASERETGGWGGARGLVVELDLLSL